MSERTEVISKIAMARKVLQATANELDMLATDKHTDVADLSNDAFNALVVMLHKLKDNYCIETLTQDALDYEEDE